MRRQMVITMMYNNNSIQQQTHGNKTDVTFSFMLKEKNPLPVSLSKIFHALSLYNNLMYRYVADHFLISTTCGVFPTS